MTKNKAIIDKISELNNGKTLYLIVDILEKPKIYKVYSKQAHCNDDKTIIVFVCFTGKSLCFSKGYFHLNDQIFETKEEALDKIVKVKQMIMKDLAVCFKKEKQILEDILEDIESVFVD